MKVDRRTRASSIMYIEVHFNPPPNAVPGLLVAEFGEDCDMVMIANRLVDLVVQRLTARGEGYRCNAKEQVAAERVSIMIIQDGRSASRPLALSIAHAMAEAARKLQPMEPAYRAVQWAAITRRQCRKQNEAMS